MLCICCYCVTRPLMKSFLLAQDVSVPMNTVFLIQTFGPALCEFTKDVSLWLRHEANGLLTVFVQYTSVSLLIQENVNPKVQGDLDAFLNVWCHQLMIFKCLTYAIPTRDQTICPRISRRLYCPHRCRYLLPMGNYVSAVGRAFIFLNIETLDSGDQYTHIYLNKIQDKSPFPTK